MIRALFAEEEGGLIKLWPSYKMIPKKDLAEVKTPVEGNRYSWNGFKFHAIWYPDGVRWDARNGFTGEAPDRIIYFKDVLIPQLEAKL